MSTTTIQPPPERTLAQRRDALAMANEVRTARHHLKLYLQGGKPPEPILNAPPEWAENMKVIDVLLALPRIGRVSALKMLSRNEISPVKTLGGLTGRQRDLLLRALEGKRKR